MKGIVDESEEVAVIYIDGKPSAKYAKKHEAERDAEFMRKRHPNKKIEIKHEVRETEAIKGADGKRCWKGKRYAGTENGKDKCIPAKNEAANPAQQAAIAIAKKKKAKTNEGVIVGHDANDPEVAILGGAGTMSLSRLKKKAHQEALQLADDIANGKYSASSYNMKQLHNTLNTIVAAEKEMEQLYFGEAREMSPALKAAQKNLVDLSTGEVRRREASRKAAEKGQRAASKYIKSLDKKPSTDEVWRKIEDAIANSFPDGDPYDTLWPWLNRNGLDNDDVVRAARKQGYKDLWDYWNILSRDIGHEVMNEMPDTSGPVGTQPGGWRKTDLDEYREMSPALKAAQQNLIALRNKEKTVNVPGKRERTSRDKVEIDKPKPASVLTKGGQAPNPEMDRMMADFLARGGEIKKGRPGKAPPTGRQQASKHIGGGGKYRKKSDTPGQGANYRGAAIVAVEEDTAYASGMGQGGNSGESYRKFKPKSAGTFKESAILKGIKNRLD